MPSESISIYSYRQYRSRIKGKTVLLQAWSGPEGSRKLRFPNFMTKAQESGKVVSIGHLNPQEMRMVLISVRG